MLLCKLIDCCCQQEDFWTLPNSPAQAARRPGVVFTFFTTSETHHPLPSSAQDSGTKGKSLRGDVLGVVCPSLHDSLQFWGRVSNLHAIQMGNRAQNPRPYARLGMGPAVQNHRGCENTEFYRRRGLGRAAQTHCQSAEFVVKMLETWQKLSVLSVGKHQTVFMNISSSQGERS